METVEAVRQRLDAALPIGTESAAVAAYLDREKIEHSELLEETLSKRRPSLPGEQVIHAAIREPAGTKLTARVVTIDFRFGPDRRLASTDVREQFTGP